MKLREICFDQDYPSSQLHPWGVVMLFPSKTVSPEHSVTLVLVTKVSELLF